jgi:hypothetical protein
MADPRGCPVLTAEAVQTVAEVIDRLTEIRDGTAALAPECGITHFSDLYLTITGTIEGHIRRGGFFADDEYLARLDVVFANRYFDALRAWAGGGTPPACWKLLFDLPDNGEITAIQLAGGGVNAHINLDLAVAVVDTGREMGDPGLAGRKADYEKVNDVFAEDMARLVHKLLEERAEDSTGHLQFVEKALTRLVAVSRRHAGDDAGTLWPLPRRSAEWAAEEALLDKAAYWTGHLVLADVPG